MAGNVNFVTATIGAFGIVGLILLYLLRKSRKTAKRKDSNTDVVHVENPNNGPNIADSPSNVAASPEALLYKYLCKNYWSKWDKQCEENLPHPITFRDFKHVCRVIQTSPKILVIYSRKSVWELGLSDLTERGYREQFSLALRGPESPSNSVRMMKLEWVMNDLVEFRKVYIISYHSHFSVGVSPTPSMPTVSSHSACVWNY